ncbi:hypothetical protein ACWGJP_13395 [Microbacterium sp. NPDC055903]
MTRRQLRLVRAAAASGIATILAAVSHTLGGGMPPHPLLVLSVSVLLVPAAAALVGGRLSAARLALTVLVAQLAFHLLFHALGGGLSTAPGGITAVHDHAPVVLGPVVAVAPADAPMVLAHICAAVLTALLLWHGERAVRRVFAWVQARLLAPLRVPAARHDVPGIPTAPLLPPSLAPLRSSVVRRGPPLA